MSSSLLAVTIGPVQEFIAQARRSRDLWFGSHALSEIARAAAKAGLDAGAEQLVFPALDADAADLEPCDEPVRSDGTPPLNVSNQLLVVVPADRRGDIARAMAAAARGRWREMANHARKQLDGTGLIAAGCEQVWDEQIDCLLEIYAAAHPFNGEADYATVRRRCMQTLAARKALRDFRPWQHDRAGAPKSSFDGGRVSLLAREQERRSAALAAAQKYRLLSGEQLDAVGIVKRCGGRPEQFVPLANVALADWLEKLRRRHGELLAPLVGLCRQHRVSRVVRRDLTWVGWNADGEAFDAELFLEDRLAATLAEQGVAADAVDGFKDAVKEIHEKIGHPPRPHVCCLVADGDRMGQAVGRLASAAEHRRLSAGLSRFAGKAREILNRRGFVVYAGGDDVLGFLPPAAAVVTAVELRKAFAETIAAIDLPQLAGADQPTLSVGLGIGHLLDGMAHLLELGRQAERLAKAGEAGREGRDSLAVVVDRRSGGTVEWWDRWSARPEDQLGRLGELLGEALPMGKVFEVGRMLQRLPEPPAVPGAEVAAMATVLRGEASRILGRAFGDQAGKQLCAADVGLSVDSESPERGSYSTIHRAVSRWINLCLVCRDLPTAGATPASGEVQA